MTPDPDTIDLDLRAADAWRDPARTVPFMKGRVALHAILKAAGIGPGHEVLVPGFTCIVVPAAIAYTGARPVYYDIDEDLLQGDEDAAISQLGEQTRAVIVQHNFGVPAPSARLSQACRDRGVLMIEDCAHAMGASVAGQPLGTLGQAAFSSLQWSKPVSAGLGGIARANDDDLLGRLRTISQDDYREPSILKSLNLWMLSTLYRRLFNPRLFWQARRTYALASRLGLLQGSSHPAELESGAMPPSYCQRFGKVRERSLRRALAELPANLDHRRRLADRYRGACRDAGVRVQPDVAEARSAWLRFPLLVEGRRELLDEAKRRRLELGDWFSAPLHPAGANAAAFGYRPGRCPRADWVAARMINLPTHPRVTMTQAEDIAAFVLGSGAVIRNAAEPS